VQALSNTVWAFSKLEVLDAELFGDIAREAAAKLPRFNAQNIANTVEPPSPPVYICARITESAAALHAQHSNFGQITIKLMVWHCVCQTFTAHQKPPLPGTRRGLCRR
jgi:hypothetical protein